MNDDFRVTKRGNSQYRGHSAAVALRNRLFDKVAPMLAGCDEIPDSITRLMVQACCLDLVTALEDLIEEFDLESCHASMDS